MQTTKTILLLACVMIHYQTICTDSSEAGELPTNIFVYKIPQTICCRNFVERRISIAEIEKTIVAHVARRKINTTRGNIECQYHKSFQQPPSCSAPLSLLIYKQRFSISSPRKGN